jgi:hypothetical protein
VGGGYGGVSGRSQSNLRMRHTLLRLLSSKSDVLMSLLTVVRLGGGWGTQHAYTDATMVLSLAFSVAGPALTVPLAVCSLQTREAEAAAAQAAAGDVPKRTLTMAQLFTVLKPYFWSVPPLRSLVRCEPVMLNSASPSRLPPSPYLALSRCPGRELFESNQAGQFNQGELATLVRLSPGGERRVVDSQAARLDKPYPGSWHAISAGGDKGQCTQPFAVACVRGCSRDFF